MILIFRKDKQFIGLANNLPDTAKANFLTKEVSEEYADASKWRWVGDYDTGKFISTEAEKIPSISTEELEALVFSKIDKKYPLATIINILIKQIRHISNGKEKTSFKNMADILLQAEELHKFNQKKYHELHGPTNQV